MPTIADLRIDSDEFDAGGRLPDVLSADGGNWAPSFRIDGVPAGTVELALVAHDPDAPLPFGFTHWVRYGIPADTTDLDPTAGRPGPNGLGENAYTGPRPPAGHGVHHYYFWVYALDRTVQGEPTREEVLARYADDVVEQARIVGTFSTP